MEASLVSTLVEYHRIFPALNVENVNFESNWSCVKQRDVRKRHWTTTTIRPLSVTTGHEFLHSPPQHRPCHSSNGFCCQSSQVASARSVPCCTNYTSPIVVQSHLSAAFPSSNALLGWIGNGSVVSKFGSFIYAALKQDTGSGITSLVSWDV